MTVLITISLQCEMLMRFLSDVLQQAYLVL